MNQDVHQEQPSESSVDNESLTPNPPLMPASAISAALLEQINSPQLHSAMHVPIPDEAVDSSTLDADSFAKVEQSKQQTGEKALEEGTSGTDITDMNEKLRASELRCKKLEQDLKKERKQKNALQKEVEKLQAIVQSLKCNDSNISAKITDPPVEERQNWGFGGKSTPNSARRQQNSQHQFAQFNNLKSDSKEIKAEEPLPPEVSGMSRNEIASLLRQAMMDK